MNEITALVNEKLPTVTTRSATTSLNEAEELGEEMKPTATTVCIYQSENNIVIVLTLETEATRQ